MSLVSAKHGACCECDDCLNGGDLADYRDALADIQGDEERAHAIDAWARNGWLSFEQERVLRGAAKP